MKKFFIIGIICFMAAMGSIATEKQDKVCFNGKCFNVEFADNPEKRSKGLMYRESLALDSGMLFVFESEGNYSFWMKDTKISLDIIWLNKDKEVIYIVYGAQPCKTADCPSVQTTKQALYVLELNAGTAARINLALGDKAIIINRGKYAFFSSISNLLRKEE